MGCVSSDGSLTRSAQALLEAVTQPATPAEVAERTGTRLFQARSGLRELVAAGLIVERDGRYERPSDGG